jgi:hypothetical protein
MIGLAILTATMLRHINTHSELESQPEPMQILRPATLPIQPDVCCID